MVFIYFLEIFEMNNSSNSYYKPDTVIYYTTPDPCLHKKCTSCGGTGIKKDGSGPCIHMISCPCPMCSPRC